MVLCWWRLVLPTYRLTPHLPVFYLYPTLNGPREHAFLATCEDGGSSYPIRNESPTTYQFGNPGIRFASSSAVFATVKSSITLRTANCTPAKRKPSKRSSWSTLWLLWRVCEHTFDMRDFPHVEPITTEPALGRRYAILFLSTSLSLSLSLYLLLLSPLQLLRLWKFSL